MIDKVVGCGIVVVFQFVLSILLITGALIVARQIDYIRSKDVGYARENLVFVPMNGNLTTHYDAFRDAALAFVVLTYIRIAGGCILFGCHFIFPLVFFGFFILDIPLIESPNG